LQSLLPADGFGLFDELRLAYPAGLDGVSTELIELAALVDVVPSAEPSSPHPARAAVSDGRYERMLSQAKIPISIDRVYRFYSPRPGKRV
jgi:hypothetical protein